LQSWNDGNILAGFSTEDRAHHPFRLIYQTLAMCHDRLIRSDLDVDVKDHHRRTREHFRHAADQMLTGGPLLCLLGHAAELRGDLLDAHVASKSAPSPDHSILGRKFQQFRSHVQSHFGHPAWGEQEDGTTTGYFGDHAPGPGDWVERSESVLKAILFNYW